MNHKNFLLVPLLLLINGLVYAANVPIAEQQKIQEVLAKVAQETGRQLPIDNIQVSPIPGLLQVTSGLNIFYITSDGHYVVLGEILDTNKEKKNWSVTEQAARQLRIKSLTAIKDSDEIIFPAMGKKIGTIYVFTDLDCYYCQKLQLNVQDYTNAGIEVRYLAFPRSGPGTPSFDKAISIWCSKDKVANFNKAAGGEPIATNLCSNNSVLAEFELGKKMGVSGTPTLFLDNGVRVGGYVEVPTLLEIFKETK